jgi:hypothetical protein
MKKSAQFIISGCSNKVKSGLKLLMVAFSLFGCVTDRTAQQKPETSLRSTKTAEEGLVNKPKKIYGVTLDSVENIDEIVQSLKAMKYKPTVRIVFDEKIPAENYVKPLTKIRAVSYIMGELVDSYYMKNYSIESNRVHTKEYLNTLGDLVDIWEVGNEVNGEWLGPTADVVKKINDSYELISQKGKVSALTLYFNEGCWEKPESEMFSWTHKNISENIRNTIDYVFISYYEDDCDGPKPEWKQVFDKLSKVFPNSNVGFGEVGSKHLEKKSDYIKKYYSLKLDQSRFVGGYFWWYFHQDMVPSTKPLFQTLNSSMTE